MRLVWTSIFCVIFMVSGTLVSTAHTLAHSETIAEQEIVNNHDHLVESSHIMNDKGGESQSHSEDSHDTNEHGAELHFTFLDIALPEMAVTVPRRNLKVSYLAIHFPSPKLPPDPFPDRA